MFSEYDQFAEHAIVEDIKKDISGDLQKSFIAIGTFLFKKILDYFENTT